MTNLEFINKLRILEAYETHYALGCFGQPVSDSIIEQKKKQLPKWYTSSKVKELKALPKNTRLFDCVNMIKAILWGFPETKYNSNGVPDTNADGMIKLCKDVSEDFSNIIPGEVVWMSGHIGVYIGEGIVLECTPKWSNKVQYTGLTNYFKCKSCAHARTWKKHGKLPWITYGEVKKDNAKIKKVVTKGSNLNCRKQPSLVAPILSKFKNGAFVTVISSSGSWSYVRGSDIHGKDLEGYVSTSYLKEV